MKRKVHQNVAPAGVPYTVDSEGLFKPIRRDDYPVLQATLIVQKPKRQIGFTAKWEK